MLHSIFSTTYIKYNINITTDYITQPGSHRSMAEVTKKCTSESKGQFGNTIIKLSAKE